MRHVGRVITCPSLYAQPGALWEVVAAALRWGAVGLVSGLVSIGAAGGGSSSLAPKSALSAAVLWERGLACKNDSMSASTSSSVAVCACSPRLWGTLSWTPASVPNAALAVRCLGTPIVRCCTVVSTSLMDRRPRPLAGVASAPFDTATAVAAEFVCISSTNIAMATVHKFEGRCMPVSRCDGCNHAQECGVAQTLHAARQHAT